jgi:predicted membrane-bound spermidine synthase
VADTAVVDQSSSEDVMTIINGALIVLTSIVVGVFAVGMGLGFLLGRRFDDAGPGDPPLLAAQEDDE